MPEPTILSPTSSQSPSPQLVSSPKILDSRSQYRPCHIRLPGEPHRIAAILVNNQHYSLIKISKDAKQAQTICARLSERGHEAVITVIAKGYGIWRHEPDACIAPSHAQSQSTLCKILDSPDQYRLCHVRVPDLDARLQAIQVEANYYGLFKTVETRQHALEIAEKLRQRGDGTIITNTKQGSSIWVLEPEAEAL